MSNQDIFNRIDKGELKLHNLELEFDLIKAREIRLKYIEYKSGCDLKEIYKTSLNEQCLYKKNIENLIGSVELPLGVAGPLTIHGDFANGSYYIPLATTEGALVASTNRGASIVSKSGGVNTISELVGITRGPIFVTNGLKQVKEINKYIEDNINDIKKLVEDREKHLRLKSIDPYNLGKNLWLRLYFDSSEAMGMNMITKSAGYISKFLCDKFKGLKLIAVSGNMCVDKKASFMNSLKGRGRKVSAEVLIPKELVEKSLKTTVDKLVEINEKKVWQGSAMSGSISFNAHFANIIAAIFAATGQDIAHIVDSSQGYSLFEKQGNDLYVAVNLPSLILGHIGGGTGLIKQYQSRILMLSDIKTKKTIESNFTSTLAEIVAGAVLCGEISLHAALASDHLISAHESLGRSKK